MFPRPRPLAVGAAVPTVLAFFRQFCDQKALGSSNMPRVFALIPSMSSRMDIPGKMGFRAKPEMRSEKVKTVTRFSSYCLAFEPLTCSTTPQMRKKRPRGKAITAMPSERFEVIAMTPALRMMAPVIMSMARLLQLVLEALVRATGFRHSHMRIPGMQPISRSANLPMLKMSVCSVNCLE